MNIPETQLLARLLSRMDSRQRLYALVGVGTIIGFALRHLLKGAIVVETKTTHYVPLRTLQQWFEGELADIDRHRESLLEKAKQAGLYQEPPAQVPPAPISVVTSEKHQATELIKAGIFGLLGLCIGLLVTYMIGFTYWYVGMGAAILIALTLLATVAQPKMTVRAVIENPNPGTAMSGTVGLQFNFSAFVEPADCVFYTIRKVGSTEPIAERVPVRAFMAGHIFKLALQPQTFEVRGYWYRNGDQLGDTGWVKFTLPARQKIDW